MSTETTTGIGTFENFTNGVIEKINFTWIDYTFFSSILFLSALIGIYFGFFGKKQDTKEEYLLGGKTMKVFPVAMSLIASHISGITLLALPSDVYRFGANYLHTVTGIVLVCILTSYVFLPVYKNLQLTSIYQYLKLRFDNKMKNIISLLFVINTFLYNPIVIYIPALAFAQATGISVHLISPLVCSICIFYTTIGGLKAVVWSDTLQFICTLGTSFAVFILGIRSSGGVRKVWETSLNGGRLDIFDFDPDPTKRDTFWAVTIGQFFNWISIVSFNQGCVQRYLAVPTISDARKTIVIFGFGTATVKIVCAITGLILFTKYHDCDPLSTKVVERPDQLLPYYVMDVAKNIPGLSGLFIAGIFSAALSTLSATLNTLAGIIYEDFVSPVMPKDTTEKTASNVIKLIVVISGIVCTASVFLLEHLGSLLQLSISIVGITSGPVIGLFILGMIFPTANTQGAFWGSIISLVINGIMVCGFQYYNYTKAITYPIYNLTTDGCPNLFNITNSPVNSKILFEQPKPFFLFRISHYYTSAFGTIIVIVFGLIISHMTRKKSDPPVRKDLLSPVIYFTLDKKESYYSVEKAMEMVVENKIR